VIPCSNEGNTIITVNGVATAVGKPLTPHPKPQITKPQPQTSNLKPQTVNRFRVGPHRTTTCHQVTAMTTIVTILFVIIIPSVASAIIIIPGFVAIQLCVQQAMQTVAYGAPSKLQVKYVTCDV
jgi:hypothetical protein